MHLEKEKKRKKEKGVTFFPSIDVNAYRSMNDDFYGTSYTVLFNLSFYELSLGGY